MRKALIAAGGLALALTLGACGDNSIGGSGTAAFDNAQSLVAAAKESTAEAKTAKFTMDFSFGRQSMNAAGEGRFDGVNSAMKMTMRVMGQNMEMRLVDEMMYLKMPGGMPGAESGKAWIKMSMTDLPGGNTAALENSDPAKMLETLVQTGNITSSEQTQLDGVDTTHYTIDVDVAKMMESVGEADARTQQKMKEMGVKTVPMELWLNSDNLPVQVVMDMTEMMGKLAKESSGSVPSGPAKMTMKYTDWGTEVDVDAPPADQVSEFDTPTMPK